MANRLTLARWFLLPLIPVLLALVACSGGSPTEAAPVLKISGIPDQDATLLARRFQQFADYMSQELGVPVEYIPSASYAAVVTAFTRGDLHLAFFGGFTGVQARLQNPGARAIVQRETDAQFHSKFIARAGRPLESLEDLKEQAPDLTITFGSESSTSGHLMPRYFMTQAGIDPDADFRSEPNFSSSHDLTWQLVEGGSFDVGVLSEEVWDRAVREGRVDTTRAREFYTTPAYLDYNWTARPDLDQIYGPGFTDRTRDALLKLNMQEHGEILELFATEKFIETNNDNYAALEQVGRSLGLIQ